MTPKGVQLVVVGSAAVAAVWAVDYASLDGIVALALVGAALVVTSLPLWSVGPTVRTLARRSSADGRVAAVGAGGFVLSVVLTHVLAAPSLTCDRPATWCTTPYGAGLALALAGTLAASVAAGNLGHYRRLRRARRAASLPGTGAVVAAGTARTAGETVESPVDEARSLCRRLHVDVRAGGRIRDERWYPAAVAERAVPFYVESRSGRVLVDPSGGDLDFSAGATPVERVVEAGEALPGSVGVGESEDRDRRVREERLVAGEEVCVVGEAVEVSRAEYEDSPVVGGDGAPVLVAAGPRRAAERLIRRRAVGVGLLGLAFGGGGYAAMILGSI